MINIDMDNMNLENIGSWPKPFKIAIIVSIIIALSGLSYWLILNPQSERLANLTQEEEKLRVEFEEKQQKSANLKAYKRQLTKMKAKFSDMLRQLPSKTEIPGLLEDISKAGVASGLQFRLFDPLQDENKEFYVELPIRISVVGTYHEIATFISRMASLNRIVTMHDFEIMHLSDHEKQSNRNKKKIKYNELIMHVTAKIYRYAEEG